MTLSHLLGSEPHTAPSPTARKRGAGHRNAHCDGVRVRIDTRHQVMGRTGHPDIHRNPTAAAQDASGTRIRDTTVFVAGSIRESIPLRGGHPYSPFAHTNALFAISNARRDGSNDGITGCLYTRYRGVPAIRYPDTIGTLRLNPECIRFRTLKLLSWLALRQ